MALFGKEAWWECHRCKYRLQVKDENGKPYKKVPKTCPSCGAPPPPTVK